MKKALVMLSACVALSGCQTAHYSDHVLSELQDAKAKCSQLQQGMQRQEVESILQPIPSSGLGFEWNISGILSVSYQLYSGIQVAVEYNASTGTLALVPDKLSVNLNSRNEVTGHFREIALDQIP